jgi:hypothetical protein
LPRKTLIELRLEKIQAEILSLVEERERLQREYSDLDKGKTLRMKSCGDD